MINKDRESNDLNISGTTYMPPNWVSRFTLNLNNRFFALCFLLLLGLVLILGGLPLGPAQAAPPTQAPDTPPSILGGGALWAKNCRPCHGPTGQGDGPVSQEIEGPLPDLSDPEAARQSALIDTFNVIKNGRAETLMPPWSERLNDAQIWDATAYVWSLSANSQDLQAGETLYLEQCSACHSENGAGNAFEAAADVVDFTNLQVMVQQSQVNLQAGFAAGAKHTKLVDTLSEEEQWQVLDYIRSLSFALPKSNGILTGQVINGSTDKSEGDIEVTLHALSDDGTEVEKYTTQADSAGRYTFENLSADHAIQYAVEGRYNDIVYMSEQPAVFPPESTETTLDLIVYDTTSDDTAIGISQFNYLISFGPDTIQTVHIFVLSNSSNRVYTGQNGETFVFSLPPNAESEVFEGDFGGRFIPQDGGGYADTLPIRPGQESHTIHARYLIPFDGDSLTIKIPIPADIANANVLLQEIGASLSSDQLEFAETLEGHGDKFTIYGAENLSKGDILTLELTNLDELDFSAPPPNAPGASTNTSANTSSTGPVDQNLLLWIVAGLGGLAIVVAGLVYPMMRPQLTPQTDTHYEDVETRRQKLMLMLVRLDEAFEAGELDEAVYRQARAKYKAELAGIMESG